MHNLPGGPNATPLSSPLPIVGQQRSSPTTSLERVDLSSGFEGISSIPPHLASPFSSSSFTSKPYSHLPTPQSPSNFGNYLRNNTYISESPVAHGSSRVLSTPTSHRLPSNPDTRIVSQPLTQQIATPESSPFSRYHSPSRQEASTLKGPSPFPPRDSYGSFALQPSTSTDSSRSQPLEEQSSQLSSPFMEKSSIKMPSTAPFSSHHSPTRSYRSHTPPLSATDPRGRSSSPARDGNGSSFFTPNPSTPATPLQRTLQAPQTPQLHTRTPSQETPMGPPPGGELDRIRQAMTRERMVQMQEAETRRPDYLKRSKRMFSDADPFGLEEEEVLNQSNREREGLVGIMESPIKGRRLTLFQETSEESFEESLMAGGYGRYRTADWVWQPQPSMLATPGALGPSHAISVLEHAQEVPPSDKELKKRRRLAAFSESRPSQAKSKLQPMQLEGRGRVLVDLATEEGMSAAAAESSTGKKKAAGTRRKKKGSEADKRFADSQGDLLQERPNWPDTQFPWRVRLEEREEAEKEQQNMKLKWVERFLDRDDSDDDDDELSLSLINETNDGDGLGQTSSTPAHTRMGRGKMVPLAMNPDIRPFARRHTMFPSDPADARTALLSKKSVRTLSYRQQKRQRRRTEGEGDLGDEEVLCICRGTDDGRELVQCDGCETWYHLECIGIKDISELGKEEDPWYCRICEEAGRSPFVDQTEEPTFVPTDNTPSLQRSHDTTFFQPSLQDSPMPWSSARMPSTPDRGTYGGTGGHHYSDSTWVDSSGHGPRTPQQRTYDTRVYTGTPGFGEPYGGGSHDTPFDPTSTPSRGLKFGAPFATPKNGSWSIRGSGPFQTPSRPMARSSWNRAFGGPGTLTSALDDHGFYERTYGDDESPIRRVGLSEFKSRHTMDSPSAPRSLNSVSRTLFDESQVVRFRDVDERDMTQGSEPEDSRRGHTFL